MLQNFAVKVSTPTQLERSKALGLLIIQILFSLATAAAWCVAGKASLMQDVLLGAVTCYLPHFLFTVAVLALSRRMAAKSIAMVFLLGEFSKLLLSGLCLALLIIASPNQLLPIVSGFLGAQLGAWVAPLIIAQFPIVKSHS